MLFRSLNSWYNGRDISAIERFFPEKTASLQLESRGDKRAYLAILWHSSDERAKTNSYALQERP